MAVLGKSSIILVLLQISVCYGSECSQNSYSKLAATYGIGAFDDEVDWTRHPCKRECRDHTKPLTCRYGLTVENYSSMSKACYDCPRNVSDCYRPHCIPADGNNGRMVLVANRQLPGPSIEVCEGDRIIVDVTNQLVDEVTTIHWHGERQRGSAFMDGVPMVSQCPIAPGDSFRYDFRADTPGTMFWHGHSALQRSDGLFGALTVRQLPSKNLVGHLYDRDEHLILLNEWSHEMGSNSYVLQVQNGLASEPHSILINGFGPYGNDLKNTLIPRPIFRVEKNSRHRFRVVNAGSYICMFYLTVDRHPLVIISTDGADVEPVQADAIRLTPGERYDFVIHANQEVGNYWIRVMADVSCFTKKVYQEAILRYEGAPDANPTEPIGYGVGFGPEKRMLNPFNEASETKGALCISCVLRSLEPDDLSLKPEPDYRFYLPYDSHIIAAVHDYHRKNLYEYYQVPPSPKRLDVLLLDHISYKNPKFPLQTEPELIEPHHLCNVSLAKCTQQHCTCTHTLQFKLNTTVELILIDEGIYNTELAPSPQQKLSHPMHMHGYHYRVAAMKKINNGTITAQQVKALDQAGKIHRNLKNAPKKDVLNVPSGGYAVIRFLADNPGYWFFHCHYDEHSHNGMALVIKIGEHEDFPAVPKDFPKC